MFLLFFLLFGQFRADPTAFPHSGTVRLGAEAAAAQFKFRASPLSVPVSTKQCVLATSCFFVWSIVREEKGRSGFFFSFSLHLARLLAEVV